MISPSANSVATMLISKIGEGWQKGEYIYVPVGESSDFHHALTNQLPEGGWSRAGALLVMVCCCDILWNLNLRGLVGSWTACQSLGSAGASAFFILE
jgi:hypothetical protein